MLEWIGLIAGALTSLSFFPQALKLIRLKQLNGISLTMYICFTLGVTLWVIYGFFFHSISIVICNAVTLIPANIILFLKIKDIYAIKQSIYKSTN